MAVWLKRACMLAAVTLMVAGAGCSLFDDPDGDGSSTILLDTDGDGIPDIDDTDIDGDGILNSADTDMDGDVIPNTSDTDMDGDGVLNINDNDIDGDGIRNTNDGDIDGDGIPNSSDSDLDGDGIPNAQDADIDGDGIPNASDTDMDNDGIPNTSDSVPDGTGDGSSGTQGNVNTGVDQNTGDNDDAVAQSGVVLEASDEMSVTFMFSNAAAGGTTEQTELVDLEEIRSEVENNDIDLQTAYVKTMKVTASSQSQAFVSANQNVRAVLKVYYQQVGAPGTRVLIAQTPEQNSAFPMVTFSDLQTGISLNSGLYVVMPGYNEYMAVMKDESKAQVEIVTEVTNVDALSSTGTLSLNVETVVAGKKAL